MIRRAVHGLALLAYLLAQTLAVTHAHFPSLGHGAPGLEADRGADHPDAELCRICAGIELAAKALPHRGSIATHDLPRLSRAPLPRHMAAPLPLTVAFRSRAPPSA